jgi:hypothetical protein
LYPSGYRGFESLSLRQLPSQAGDVSTYIRDVLIYAEPDADIARMAA